MVNRFKSLICVETLTIPLLIYALVKLILPLEKSQTLLLKNLFKLLHFLITLCLIPLTLSLLVIFATYFEIVKCFAKSEFGDNFFEQFHGADAIWVNNTPECRSTIHVMFLLENQHDTPQKVMEYLSDKNYFRKIFKNHPRLSCFRKYFYGYNYFVRTKIDLSEVIHYLNDYNNSEEFHQSINQLTISKLPYDDEFMWEIYIGTKPVELQSDKLQIPVVLRIHHSLTDGIGLIAFTLVVHIQNGVKQFKTEHERFNKCLQRQPNKENKTFDITKFLNRCKSLLSDEVYYHFDFIRSKDNPNLIHQPMSGSKFVSFSAESTDEQLIDQVKKTKTRLKVSFSDIIMSAICAAVTEHFRKFDNNAPKQIYCGTTYYLNADGLEKLLKFDKDGNPIIEFGNKFTCAFSELPTDQTLLENPLIIVDKVHKTSLKFKSSMDLHLIYWLFNVFATVVPKPLVEAAAKLFNFSILISNVPGFMPASLRTGHKIENIFTWTTNFNCAGISVAIITYGYKLHIALNIDDKNIGSQEDAQKLGDDILKYIRVLCEKACKDC